MYKCKKNHGSCGHNETCLRNAFDAGKLDKWIACSKKMPAAGQVVDIWVFDEYMKKYHKNYHGERYANYIYKKNFNGSKGNNFFDPALSGVCGVRNATHWMPLPKPPFKSKEEKCLK